MTQTLLRARFALPLLLSLFATLTQSSCGHERVRIEFPVEVVGIVESGPNKRGWDVELESAHANVGPVHFHEGRPLFSRALDAFPPLIRTAHAHPGHYDPSEALGELLETKVVDLLADEPTLLGMASGFSGPYGSAEVALPVGLASDDLVGEASFRIVGTATRKDEEGGVVDTVPFEAAVPVDHSIPGLPFEYELDESTGTVRIGIHLARWFENVDFASLQDIEPNEDDRHPVLENTQAFNALVRGASDGAAYQLTLAAGARP